jgi:hypothetical protein
MCRGNYRAGGYSISDAPSLIITQGRHFAKESYARVAIKLFHDLDVDALYVRVIGSCQYSANIGDASLNMITDALETSRLWLISLETRRRFSVLSRPKNQRYV